MVVTNLNNCFINYECRDSSIFVIDLTRTKSLNPIPYGNMTPFPSLNMTNALKVFHRLRPRKYRLREYITIAMDILFLSNNLMTIID
jgi:hypothetical protein